MIERLSYAAVCAAMLLCFAGGEARAWESQVTPERYFQQICSGDSYNLHWPNAVVVVKVNNSAASGVQLLRRNATAYWTVNDFVRWLKIALAEFNNLVPANVTLIYGGTTSNLSETGAIVFLSDAVPTNTLANAPAMAGCQPGGFGTIASAQVILHRRTMDNVERIFRTEDDSLVSHPDDDIVVAFTHEIGHALGLTHINSYSHYDSGGQVYDPADTVMNASNSSRPRYWHKYEKQTLVNLYGYRGASLSLYQSIPIQTIPMGSLWTNVDATTNIFLPTYATSGGLGELTDGVNPILMMWRSTNAPRLRGATRSQTSNGGLYINLSTNADAAPAMVYGDGEYRIYYVEEEPWTQLPNGNSAEFYDSYKRLRWISANGVGGAWQLEPRLTQYPTLNESEVLGARISAGYDPVRKLFVVLWLNYFNQLVYQTFPGPGSLQTTPHAGIVPIKFHDVPSIACSTFLDGCLLAGMSFEFTPSLITYRGQFDASGAWVNASVEQYPTLPMIQAPSVTWSQPSGFILSYVGATTNTLNAIRRGNIGLPWATSSPNLLATFPATVAVSPPATGVSATHALIGVLTYSP